MGNKKIYIGTYKGYKIFFYKGEFVADRKGVVVRSGEYKYLKARISGRIKEERDRIREEKETEKKKRELARKEKELAAKLRLKYVVPSKELRELVKACGWYVDDIILELGKEQIKVTQIDRAGVLIFNYSVPCKGAGKPLSFSVDAGRLGRVLSLVEGDKLTLQPYLQKDGTFGLKVIDSAGSEWYTKSKAESHDPKVPKLSYDASLVITADDFRKVLRQVESVGDSVVIEAKKGVVVFGSFDENEAFCSKEFKGKGEARGKYSLDYLNKKYFKKGRVKLEWGNDYPLRVSQGKNWIILAPRVGDNR